MTATSAPHFPISGQEHRQGSGPVDPEHGHLLRPRSDAPPLHATSPANRLRLLVAACVCSAFDRQPQRAPATKVLLVAGTGWRSKRKRRRHERGDGGGIIGGVVDKLPFRVTSCYTYMLELTDWDFTYGQTWHANRTCWKMWLVVKQLEGGHTSKKFCSPFMINILQILLN
jgi:hypothetical protein